MWYHISQPNSYLVITGAGVENVKIKKKAFVLPFQKVTKISITPFDFPIDFQAMTSEKLNSPSGNSEGRVARGTVSTGRGHVQDIVKGIIEGETRAIVSTMTMEEIFNKRQIFKDKVIACVQSELNQFGLKVYNANVKELQDTEGSHTNQAKVDVANARMTGEVGEAEKQGETKQQIAEINATTAIRETDRKVENANADSHLQSCQIEIEQKLNLKRIVATRAAEERDAELMKGVERKKAEMQLERLRAATVTQAKIAKEAAQEKADGELYRITKEADGRTYQQRLAADADYQAKDRAAEALFITKKREADALYIARQKEAVGLRDLAGAYTALAEPLGGPQGLLQYLMMKEGVYERLADSSARAIDGLQPKINVWTTGSGEGADPGAPIRNLFQSIPPAASALFDQTGMQPPAWMMQMPKEQKGADGVSLSKQQKHKRMDSVNGS
ncbi:hypothetical protein BDV97DRAFT_394444 [Delphinella strobiligena]|nr:hypothetical protein BDV97DRAFT_394444 [Delphinella strobiligena]